VVLMLNRRRHGRRSIDVRRGRARSDLPVVWSVLLTAELDLHGSGPVPEAVLIRAERGRGWSMTDSDSVQWLARSTILIRKRIIIRRT
jgi:hypothetical protein